MFKIKNTSGELLTVYGKEYQVDEVWDIPNSMRVHLTEDCGLCDLFDEGKIQILFGSTPLTRATAKAYLSDSAEASFAVDKAGIDQFLSGWGWIELQSNRVLWDSEDSFDVETNDFVVPYDGVFAHDIQVRIENITDCDAVELAVFKRGDPDDYWFVLGKRLILPGMDEVQISANTFFDMREGERYVLKVKIYGENAAAVISGDDDFTAWGYSFSRRLL